MKCSRCGIRKAIKHPHYGYINCKVCQRKPIKGPGRTIEFTTDSIKAGRLAYKKDILQPFRDGVVSKEYVQEYGTQGLDVPDSEIKKARYTMQDTKGWWNRQKSKGGKV